MLLSGRKATYSIAPYIADDMASQHRGKLKHVYKHALNGFSVEMSEADAETLSQDFRVTFVEEDGVVSSHCHSKQSAVGSRPH